MCGLCAAGIAVGGAGPSGAAGRVDPPAKPAPEELRQPSLLRSADGVLNVRLELTLGRTAVAGRFATLLRYNGEVPGPTLLLRPGDRLSVELVNSSDQPTNLHTHGLPLSPTGNADNPFVVVDPGATFRYDYRIPADQPAGTYWYHPHHHGLAADQVFGGLYGAIVVDDRSTSSAAFGTDTGSSAAARGGVGTAADRVVVISDISLDRNGDVRAASAVQRRMGREGELVLVNGQLRPRLTTRPGARERWHLVNACVSRFLRLRLDGQGLELAGIDLPLAAPRNVREIFLAPGNRADVVITTRSGSSVLRAVAVPRVAKGMSFGLGTGGMGGPGPGSAEGGPGPVDLAELVVAGSPDLTRWPELPTGAVPDLRGAPLTAHRTITLAMGMEMQGPVGMSFSIDGHRFDPARVDQRVPAGAVEQWTIVNTSEMDHPFHLHVWPMQVVRVGSTAADEAIWQNVVNVPARSSTVVLIRFERVTGRTVYYCHILDHEDGGMMGVVEVA